MTETDTVAECAERPAGGRKRAVGSPLRRCVVTRASLPKGALVRFVVAPDGTVTPDLAGDLPGRGVYVSAERAALAKACERNMFARAFRGHAVVPGDLAARVAALARQRALSALGQARRAGLVSAGFQQVRDTVRRHPVRAVMCAVDAAANGRDKIRGLARDTTALIAPFTAEELGAALGRAPTVHVALLPGRLTERFLEEMRRADRLADSTAGTARQE